MSRYFRMFSRLRAAGEGAFVPFVMLGDPTPELSEEVVEALIDGGADALELGAPFSDPVADGPTIQRAHIRALEAGTGFADALAVVARVRARHPEIPIGMLIYGNVPFSVGPRDFYAECAKAGVDSVLLAVDAVYIAPPSADARTLDAVAASSRGYVYAVSRAGVTGTERAASTVGLAASVARLRADAAAPVMLGFGISRPDQVAEAIAAGADGAISGSATVKIVEAHAPALAAAAGPDGDPAALAAAAAAMKAELGDFVAAMKAAARRR